MVKLDARQGFGCMGRAASLLKKVSMPVISAIISGVRSAPGVITYYVKDYMKFLENKRAFAATATNLNREIRRAQQNVVEARDVRDANPEILAHQDALTEAAREVQDLSDMRAFMFRGDVDALDRVTRFGNTPMNSA
ncbi:hypothetical protein K0U07_04950 [bacterium]|nr:hypothetical protein [bacterium]